MQTRLIYRSPPEGSVLRGLLTEQTPQELAAWVGDDIAAQLAAGEVVQVGDYAAVDLVAFYQACRQGVTEEAAPNHARAADQAPVFASRRHDPPALLIVTDPEGEAA